MRRTTSCFRAVLLLLALVCPLFPARACLNDRDSDSLENVVQAFPETIPSLEYEARAFPETIQVITGRFDRNPPLFYGMRLRRVAREITAHPRNLPLYDDAAVACDRLGRDDDAIAWIEKKRELLGNTSPFDPRTREAWYRYYANVGTFRAHRWLRAGAKRARIAELKQAQYEIAQAVQINPDAHLGREWAQQWVMAWLIDPRDRTLGAYLAENRGNRSVDEVVQALSGLIVLGNAWESVDVFGAIGFLLQEEKKIKLSRFASLRVRELVEQGKHSLGPKGNGIGDTTPEATADFLTNSSAIELDFPGIDNIEGKYRALRADAEEEQETRLAYMLRGLKAGRHPDTDVLFWREYHPAPIPALNEPWREDGPGLMGRWGRRQLSASVPAPLRIVGGLSLLSVLGFIAFRRLRDRTISRG